MSPSPQDVSGRAPDWSVESLYVICHTSPHQKTPCDTEGVLWAAEGSRLDRSDPTSWGANARLHQSRAQGVHKCAGNCDEPMNPQVDTCVCRRFDEKPLVSQSAARASLRRRAGPSGPMGRRPTCGVARCGASSHTRWGAVPEATRRGGRGGGPRGRRGGCGSGPGGCRAGWWRCRRAPAAPARP